MFKDIYYVVIDKMYNKSLKYDYQIIHAHTTVEGAYQEILSFYNLFTKEYPNDDIRFIDSKEGLIFVYNRNNGEEVWEYRIKKIILIED